MSRALRAETVGDSSTLPSHSSMLSGVEVEVHGMEFDDFRPHREFIRVPTVLYRAHDAGLATAMFVAKTKLRHIAIPLPRGEHGEEVRVRLSSGAGFWRIGALGVSSLRDRNPTVTVRPATRATQPDGSDGRELLANTDGRYQALPRRGDELAVDFETPPLPASGARTEFLFASGYYRVHAQPQAQRSVPTLLRLRDEPGAMVRFSYALYREALRVVRDAPPPRP